MELSNEFRVGVSVPEAWKVLTDLERIAPMLPGAQLQEVEGDEYRGVVKVKVGPISAHYKGTATFVEQDENAGRVVLKATGRDTRGQGNASATITASMVPDGDGTKVSVLTDLTVTGKVAQFGRGVLADVSAKLIGQFVDTLEADLAGSGASAAGPVPVSSSGAATAAGAAADPAPTATGDTSTGADGAASNGSGPEAATGARRIDAPEAEPLDLLAVAGGSTLKRLVPLLGAAGVVLVLIWLLRSRRSGA
jgi:carbon monoxide dehydrogenase subunit G